MYMPASLLANCCAPSCQVSPSAPSEVYGRISRHVLNTRFTCGLSQLAFPAIRRTWKS